MRLVCAESSRIRYICAVCGDGMSFVRYFARGCKTCSQILQQRTKRKRIIK